MKILSPYSEPQRWLKGNLHTHTTRSDGTGTPDEVIAMYRDDGYDFLALTDHYRFSDGSEGGAGDSLRLSWLTALTTRKMANAVITKLTTLFTNTP